jgi:hypothetical protein
MKKVRTVVKKEICLITALMLLAGTQAAYAGTSGSDAAAGDTSLTENAAVTKSAINLSIKDAVKIMQTTGTRAETAELNKKSDQAIAAGYSEAVSTINDTLNKINYISKLNAAAGMTASMEAQEAGATETNKKVSKLRRDFAKEQIEPNYKAEMNQIEYNTLKVYYGVLLAQENLKTERGNLKAQQDILKNTKAQYEVGMLAKKDVLSAQSAVTSAQSSVQAAETKLEYAKMSFNFLLGYPATQEVVFTDSLSVVTSSAIDTEAAVKSAVDHRNEIKGADFAVKVYQVLLDDVKAYPKSSSTYLKRQISLLTAQKQAKDAPVQIEIDLRNKAAGLEDKMMALQAARAMKAYAEEGYRLIGISYDAGMTTLAELQQAQTNVYKAGLAVSAATNDYDLAYYEFRYAQDVGTERLPL